MFRRLLLAALLVSLIPTKADAQQTRAEWLEQQRAERARHLEPYTPAKIERALLFVENERILERIALGFGGVYPRLGGLTIGSGFAFGAGYRHTLPGTDAVEFDASAAVSPRGYKAADVRVRAPRLAGGRLELDGGTNWWEFPQEDFFGLGNSAAADRTNYGYSGTRVNLLARVRVRPWFIVGDDVGYLRPGISAGTDARFPSLEARFSDADAPGLTRPPRLVYTRAFIDLDYRDQPANTRGGGRVFVQVGMGRDQDPSREFSYRQTDVEVLHVFPIFDKKRNFAVRLSAAHLEPLNPDGRVPFFLLPTIGGGDSLRSYRDLRFRDATYVLLNGEYRWEAFSGLDLALFWDGGDIGRTLEDIRLSEFKTGWGFGLRFNTNRAVFLRLDVGLGGPEGTRLFFKFGPAF